MPNYQLRTFQTKSGKIYEVRNFIYDDAENLHKFFCQSTLESTHTLHYKDRNIPVSKLQERISQSLESPCDLYIGVFDQGKIIAQLFFRVAHPDHP